MREERRTRSRSVLIRNARPRKGSNARRHASSRLGCPITHRCSPPWGQASRQEVSRQAEQGCCVRLMFQDEGRSGLLGTPRRCWAPRGTRPVVGARLERKYRYAFSAVSLHDGVLDSLVLPWVNSETMSPFLAEVALRHPNEFIFMVMDQAGWHPTGSLLCVRTQLGLRPRTPRPQKPPAVRPLARRAKASTAGNPARRAHPGRAAYSADRLFRCLRR